MSKKGILPLVLFVVAALLVGGVVGYLVGNDTLKVVGVDLGTTVDFKVGQSAEIYGNTVTLENVGANGAVAVSVKGIGTVSGKKTITIPGNKLKVKILMTVYDAQKLKERRAQLLITKA